MFYVPCFKLQASSFTFHDFNDLDSMEKKYPVTSTKLIISADDFGRNKKANKNILRLLDLGKINRVSVLVDGKLSDRDIEKLLKSNAKLDIHLLIDDLQDINGHENRKIFTRITNFLKLLLSFKISPKKINMEWTGQIEKFQKLFNKFPDGINSHEHLHYFPPYFNIVLKLSKKFDIKYIRFGRKNIINKNNTVSRILRILHSMDKTRNAHFDTADYLISLDWIGKQWTDYPITGTIELVCHPEREEEFRRMENGILNK